MDTLHTVLRSIRGETKSRRNHLSVFREFLDHLDRITRSRENATRATRAKPWAISAISISSGEGSRRSSRRPDSIRCQARAEMSGTGNFPAVIWL